MKCIFTIVLFYCTLLYMNGQSYFSTGANYSVISGSQFPFGKQKLENFKLTPSIGYGYKIRIAEKWSYRPEVTLGDLGGINIPERPRTIFTILAATLNQFIDYRPVSWFSAGVSPSVYYVGYAGITGKSFSAVNGEIKIDDEKSTSWKDLPSHKLNRFVFSIATHISFHLKDRWSMDLFYRFDQTPVGYPFRVLNFTLQGYGVGANLRYQLKNKNDCSKQGVLRKK